MDGQVLRVVDSDCYLGVGVAAAGATLGPLLARVEGALATLATLRQTGALVRGMDLREAVIINKTFLRSKWLYGCFFCADESRATEEVRRVGCGFHIHRFNSCLDTQRSCNATHRTSAPANGLT